MNGYRAHPKQPSQPRGKNGAHALSPVFFLSPERALEEGRKCFFGSAGNAPDFSVEEADGLCAHYVRWSDYPACVEHVDIMLIPPEAVASSQIDRHLRRIARDFMLKEVRPATEAEVQAFVA
jgi:hypothetical protein